MQPTYKNEGTRGAALERPGAVRKARSALIVEFSIFCCQRHWLGATIVVTDIPRPSEAYGDTGNDHIPSAPTPGAAGLPRAEADTVCMHMEEQRSSAALKRLLFSDLYYILKFANQAKDHQVQSLLKAQTRGGRLLNLLS